MADMFAEARFMNRHNHCQSMDEVIMIKIHLKSLKRDLDDVDLSNFSSSYPGLE